MEKQGLMQKEQETTCKAKLRAARCVSPHSRVRREQQPQQRVLWGECTSKQKCKIEGHPVFFSSVQSFSQSDSLRPHGLGMPASLSPTTEFTQTCVH